MIPVAGAQVDESELLTFTGRRLATGKARRPEIRATSL